jgi:hypothetical protein
LPPFLPLLFSWQLGSCDASSAELQLRVDRVFLTLENREQKILSPETLMPPLLSST